LNPAVWRQGDPAFLDGLGQTGLAGVGLALLERGDEASDDAVVLCHQHRLTLLSEVNVLAELALQGFEGDGSHTHER